MKHLERAIKSEFEQIVREAFDAYRNKPERLPKSKLGDNLLAQDCYFRAEPLNNKAKKRAITVILTWAVDQLKPLGKENLKEVAWRSYAVLFYYYLQGKGSKEVNILLTHQNMGVLIPAAIAAVSRILEQELENPTDSQSRKRRSYEFVSQGLSVEAKFVLRTIAIFKEGVPLNILSKLLKLEPTAKIKIMVSNEQECMEELLKCHLIQQDGPKVLVLDDEVQNYARDKLSPLEAQTYHPLAAKYYQAQGDYLGGCPA